MMVLGRIESTWGVTNQPIPAEYHKIDTAIRKD